MNRMTKKFEELHEKGERILVTYYPLCDTAVADPIELADNYFKNGSSLLEMGLPYEDPCLDGKVIRDSMARALTKHNIKDAFEQIKELRKVFPNEVLEVMTYIENVNRIGREKLAEMCADAGVDAVLCPNASIEQWQELDKVFNKYGIINMRFATYDLIEEQIDDLIENSDGYIFLQAVNGVTGPQEKTSPKVKENVELLRKRGVTTPIVAGFGISNANQAHELIQMGADGVIVGSSLVTSILNNEYKEYVKELSNATNS